MKKTSKLEKAIILWYWEKYPFLKDQLHEDNIEQTEFSWSGFFIDFKIPKWAIKFTEDIWSPIDWPYILSPEIDTHMEAILFHSNWVVKTIDIHSFDHWISPDIQDFTISDTMNNL